MTKLHTGTKYLIIPSSNSDTQHTVTNITQNIGRGHPPPLKATFLFSLAEKRATLLK